MTEMESKPMKQTIGCDVFAVPNCNRAYGVDIEPDPRDGMFRLTRFVVDPSTGEIAKGQSEVAVFRSGTDAADFLEWLKGLLSSRKEG